MKISIYIPRLSENHFNIIYYSICNELVLITCKISSTRQIYNLITIFIFFFLLLQVWFQNRRMKDKRQRIAVAWPYAAVYADPTFAASLLQAAANSVSMPYYAPNPMIPQMPMIAPSQLPPAAATHYSYGYRYSPYQIPHRNPTAIPPHSQSSPITPTNGPIFTRDLDNGLHNNLQIDYLQSPNSPLSPLSLSPVSDSEKVNIFDYK